LHALGVIAVTFASLETSVGGLLLRVTERKNADATVPNFSGLPEKKKIRAIRRFFIENLTREDVISSIDNLLDYFDWCQHCRNQLLHAERYPGFFAPRDTMYLTKRVSKRSSKFGYVKLSLGEIRNIAEKIRAGVVQCADLSLYLRFENVPRERIPVDYLRYTEALPVKLTVPKRLKLALWPEADS
jgi:hypothetical protein